MATDELLQMDCEDIASIDQLMQDDAFIARHIGPSEIDIAEMLSVVEARSLDDLIQSTIPANLMATQDFALPMAESEVATLQRLREFAAGNVVGKSFIGQGYYGTYVPNVIARNVLENPGWYTAYTPYQAEIAQGRLETLLIFQQMVMDLTGMDFANASLLDESTAAAEAMTLCRRANKKSSSQKFFVADDVHPQTLDVIRTRGNFQGFEIVVGPAHEVHRHEVFGALLQYPGTTGQIHDLEPLIENAHQNGSLVAVATDLLALTLLKPPGEMGADVVLGSAQRFGVPMGFGGPHAAFFATRDQYKRSAPGRIIGVSKDSRGNTALRMAMQTREQHIRRDKATSNICTAQALLANMAALYAVYHGPDGLTTIATRVHTMTHLLRSALKKEGFDVVHESFFDTLLVQFDSQSARDRVISFGHEVAVNLRSVGENQISASFDETTTLEDVFLVLDVFQLNDSVDQDGEIDVATAPNDTGGISEDLQRETDFLQHPCFGRYRSETEMLRFLKRLENKDFSLTHGMIPLGSCTMKLNATVEMIPVSWPEFADVHPFAPASQSDGYVAMIDELKAWLISITGYDEMSMQPNSGAQGEYAGLLAIVRYHQSLGQGHRNVCLIPSSAHGTNPASATMMGLEVVVVNTDDDGNIDLEDLEHKATAHADHLSSLMITYPSTHGVFEETIRQACEIVHQRGGQVYMDGANMNALVGLVAPGELGSDVSHLNLHKTFCIPHGGGGPGMGPIGVKSHLAPFLPGHVCASKGQSANDANGQGAQQAFAVSGANYGSASILPISWAYINLMGGDGLKKATQIAILNANYIAARLKGQYDVLYKGRHDRVAHECIIDIRPIKDASGITEVDIAKRLMDYGFHAPTMSWPVPGTIMIEPTESESKEELDRFCDALLAIRQEIRDVEQGRVTAEESLPRNAPHTMVDLVDADWNRPYSRQQAVFPTNATRQSKFWPSINRVDDVFGDRNFVCACPPMSDYQKE
jgi:glycine dehydrogenase